MQVPSNNVIPMQRGPQLPDEKYIMMAAAQMHQEGRLLKPKDDEEKPRRK